LNPQEPKVPEMLRRNGKGNEISKLTDSLPFPVSVGYGERPYFTRVMDTQMDT